MDPIVLSILTGVGAGTGIAGTITYLANRFIKAKTAEEPRAELTAAMREEIEQTPNWWDRQFHNLLLTARTEVLVRIAGDRYDYRGEFRRGADSIALDGCTCARCARTLKKQSQIAETKIPLHNGNPRFVAELQNALGIYADGIVGVHTMRAIEATPSDWKPRTPIGPDVWELYFELKLPELQAYVEAYKAQAKALLGPKTSTAVERYKRKHAFYEEDFNREVEFWENVPVQQELPYVPF